MTATIPELDDLDLLDDERAHAACGRCHPLGSIPFLGKYDAICGRVVLRKRPWRSLEAPPNACEDCLETHICSRCGLRFDQ